MGWGSRSNRRTQGRVVLVWAVLAVVGAVLLLTALGRPAAAGQGRVLHGLGAESGALLPSGIPNPGPHAAGVQRHRVVGTIPLSPGIGQNPVAIAADPRRPLVYVANSGSWDITVLSGTTVLGMVAAVHEGTLSPYALRAAVHPTTGLLYAVEEMQERTRPYGKSVRMQVVNGTEVVTSVQLDGCSTERGGCGTNGMAFQPTTGYLYLLRWHQSHYLLPPWGEVDILEGTKVVASLGFEDVIPRYIAPDPRRGYVYVTVDLTSTDAVLVLSRTTLLATVPVTAAGLVEVQPRTGLAYVQSGGGRLVVVSGTTGLGQIVVGEVAALAADPARGYLYISHPHTPTVTVVSGTAVLTVVPLASPAGRMEVSAATGLVYLRHPRLSTVTVMSGTTVLGQVEVLSGSAAIESNPVSGLVYAVDGINTVSVLEGTRRLAVLAPAAPQPRRMEVHPRTGQVVVLSTPPTLSLIEGETIVATVPLTAEVGAMLIHPTNGLIYLTSDREDAVLVFRGTTLLATIPAMGFPTDIAVQPRTGLVYVPGYLGMLSVLSDTARVAALPWGAGGPARVATNGDNGLIYVTDRGGNVVHVFSGTQAVTDVAVYAPDAVAVEPRSGYAYVGAGGGKLWVISATTVIGALDTGSYSVIDMQPSPSSGDLYLHLGIRGIYTEWDQVGIVRGLEKLVTWPLPWPSDTRFSCLEPHPSQSYLYAGHAVYGGLVSIGVGSTLAETLTVGDGSWVRAIAADPGTGRVYVATDHAISILEVDMAYRFFMPMILVGPRMQGGY